MVTPQQWAQHEFGDVRLGDKRLTDRAVAVGAAMAADPSASIPRQNKSWKQIKGAYRLFDHEQVTLGSLCQPHWLATRQACDGCVVTLLIQDTTWLDFADHPQTQGLGWYGRARQRGRGGQGLLLHSVVAIQPQEDGQARILGLAHTHLWARTHQPRGVKGRKGRRFSADRESLRWIQALQEIGAASGGCRRLHVGDRESDLFDLYRAAQEQAGVGFVIRVKHDRNATLGHDTPDRLSTKKRRHTRLKELCRTLPTLTHSELKVASRADRPARLAKLKLCGGAVTLWSPQARGSGRALRCWALRVWEPDAPAGEKPIEWMILTSERIETAADALRVATYYTHRWLIEQYHQCLKSGCKVQQRQLQHVDRLAPLIGMLSVVAVRLLQLKTDVRLTPDKPATEVAPPQLVQTLAKLIGVQARTLTVRRFVHEVAKRGGFIGRKRDGEPGWKTLWLGWHELTLIHAGRELERLEKVVGNA